MIVVAIGRRRTRRGRGARAGQRRSGRAGAAVAGVAALAVGFVILGSARIPVEAEEAVLARAMPVDASPALASPAAMAAHDHHLATSETPVSEPLPGMGTPVSEAGLVVTLDADTLQPGPTDLTISVMDQTGAPVSEARVVALQRDGGDGADAPGDRGGGGGGGALSGRSRAAEHVRAMAAHGAHLAPKASRPASCGLRSRCHNNSLFGAGRQRC